MGSRQAELGIPLSDSENVIGFDDHDAENAVNWPARKKWAIVFVLAAMTFMVQVLSPTTPS
jgi:hypothetical protein